MARALAGWGSGLLGVVIFSASLPATRVAVGGFSPWFLTSSRAVIAAMLGAALLMMIRRTRPEPADLLPLALVAGGVVVGFPLLTAVALQTMTAAHSIVFIGLLPLVTAIFGVLRGGERPRRAFWLFSVAGAASVAGFALIGNGPVVLDDTLLMVAAIVLCGLGYAEGARLTRRLGGWQVISWALLLSLPVMVPVAVVTLPSDWDQATAAQWSALAYVSVFSMLVGFIFWYRGLALGGIAGVGQLQLLQPFFGLALAGLLLGEPIPYGLVMVTGFVVLCVFGAKRCA